MRYNIGGSNPEASFGRGGNRIGTEVAPQLLMGIKSRVSRTHRRRARMQMRNFTFGLKRKTLPARKDPDGTRDHARPRPNGRKIRVKSF